MQAIIVPAVPRNSTEIASWAYMKAIPWSLGSSSITTTGMNASLSLVELELILERVAGRIIIRVRYCRTSFPTLVIYIDTLPSISRKYFDLSTCKKALRSQLLDQDMASRVVPLGVGKVSQRLTRLPWSQCRQFTSNPRLRSASLFVVRMTSRNT